ncbi:hypothetical protein [uncultured Gimesia sp.]|uniref:anti-sigma factor n=1 Tax=uncultured Gimesia sp. TaxID=1678688 RepID=UPI0026058C92|nr:hypothetical protein [uncultured Gimesia sp.]
MSSHPSSNEKFSAYFDHEASPEERQELESLLENSVEARQELHEIGELSRLLQETATESAPPELAASIRRRIEQETLLTKAAPAEVKRVPSLLRYRIAVAVSTCSSLAALILFVLLMNTPETPWQFQTHSADQVAFQPATKPDSESTLVRRKHGPEVRTSANLSYSGKSDIKIVKAMPAPSIDFNSGTSRSVDKTKMNNGLASNGRTTKDLKGNFSVRNTHAEQKVGKSLPKSAMAPQSQPMGIPVHIPLDSIRIGQALPYFSNIDGKVAVIEVHVVDVKRALGTLELLLARNHIPVDQKKQSAVERQFSRSHILKAKDVLETNPTLAESDQSENQLFAVYVEATDKQLASALKDFQKDLQRDQLVGLALQPAIKASSLTEEFGELPQLLTQRSNLSDMDKVNSAKENSAVAGTPLRSLKQKMAVSNSPQRDSEFKKLPVSESLTKKREASKSRQNSFQMRYRMQIPAEQRGQRAKLAQLNEAKQKIGKKLVPPHLPALDASKPYSAGKNITPKQEAFQNQAPAPVKVLFVFKGAAPPTTSPAPQ